MAVQEEDEEEIKEKLWSVGKMKMMKLNEILNMPTTFSVDIILKVDINFILIILSTYLQGKCNI